MKNRILIDGKEYEAGSAEARTAQAKLDGLRNDAFAAEHPEMIERNIATIRQTLALPEKLRNDANSTALLARDLVYVSAEVERKVYEQSRIMQFVRPDTSHPRGADSYARRIMDMTGTAKVSAALAGDSPRADVSVSEELMPYRFVRGSYGYTLDDHERAAFARVPLPQWKREACIDMIARGLDKIGRSGTASDPEGDAKLRGLFNNANVTVLTLTNGEWPTATAAEILADLAEIEATIITAAHDTQPQDGYRLILPSTYEGRLLTLKADATASDLSVAKYFLANSRLIKEIVRYGALDSAVTPDIAASDAPQAICVPMNQERAGISWPMPISYEELPPEVRGYEWIVQARARCGGVEFVRPFFSLYVQNLD